MNQIMTKYIRKNSKQTKIGSFTYRRGGKKLKEKLHHLIKRRAIWRQLMDRRERKCKTRLIQTGPKRRWEYKRRKFNLRMMKSWTQEYLMVLMS